VIANRKPVALHTPSLRHRLIRLVAAAARAREAAQRTPDDARMAAHALDIEAGVWIVRVSRQGEVLLQLSGKVISMLPAHFGMALLNQQICPFERAVNIISAARGGLTVAMSRAARTDLEFELARWLMQHFDP
jgi:hypothetical protein